MVFCAFSLPPALSQRQNSPPKPKPHSPTQAPPDARYVGTKECALCHQALVEGQKENAMASALEPAAECGTLRQYPKLAFKLGRYSYAIERRGDESVYTVSDGRDTLSVPILWAFGKGKMGQTYVIRYQGQLYETRVSFYTDIKRLDLTLGAPADALPKTIEEAAGRLMSSTDAKDCFSCHAHAAVSRSELQLEKMTPGVTCESCHGPGAEHVEWIKAGNTKSARDKRIFNPAKLSPYDLSQQFCGACHRSWEQVQLMGVRGIGNVRFQPYRITYSACYNPDDRRISCAACHDVHKAPERETIAYDDKCFACHRSSGKKPSAKAKAPACKIGQENCASCHMPEYEIPGSHFRFRDHMIRIVKKGEPYPN
jgi:hypothetical protein